MMWALAVYREACETVLFQQALGMQVAPVYFPVLAGFISAAVVLVFLDG